MGERVELSDLIAPPDGAGAGERAGRIGVGVWSEMFVLDGERLTVRWRDVWTGEQSRTVAREDVARVDVEPDDRSAAGGRTWKVVLRLRGGGTIVPVRRDRRDKATITEGVAALAQGLGLAPPAPPPVFFPTPLEDLPGTRYAAMAASGEGMRPIVGGPSTTLIATGEDGGVQIRLGSGPPWLMVGADREGFWAHAVGMPAEWAGNREVGMQWVRKRIYSVRHLPGEWPPGENASTVWVQMRDGTHVRVAERLPPAEAEAVVAALCEALGLSEFSSRWMRARAYLQERRAETLGRFGGVSGDVSTVTPLNDGDSRDPRRAPIVLPYSREPAGAIRIIRGDGVLRVSVPPEPFRSAATRRAIALIPPAGLVGLGAIVMCVDVDGMSVFNALSVVVPPVALLWLAAAAVFSLAVRTELLVADEALQLERTGVLGPRKWRWRVEDVLEVEDQPFTRTVTATVREAVGGPQVTRRIVRLVKWEAGDERRRVVEVLRAAVGLDEDRGEAATAPSTEGRGA